MSSSVESRSKGYQGVWGALRQFLAVLAFIAMAGVSSVVHAQTACIGDCDPPCEETDTCTDGEEGGGVVADTDDDGVPDAEEDEVPNYVTGAVTAGFGDGNGDGDADSTQAFVASRATLPIAAQFFTLVHPGIVGASTPPQLHNVEARDEPHNFALGVAPYGGLRFTAVTVSGFPTDYQLYIDYDAAKPINGLAVVKETKFGPPQVALIENASIAHIGNKWVINFSYKDGDVFDFDNASGSLRLEIYPVNVTKSGVGRLQGASLGWLALLPLCGLWLLRRSRRVLALMLALAVVTPTQASDLYGAVMGSVSRHDTDLQLKTGYGAQVLVGAPLSGQWDWEVSGLFTRYRAGSQPGRVDVLGAGADLRYRLGTHAVQPFLLGGLGLQSENLKIFGADRENSPYLDLGVGVSMPLSAGLSLRSDLRTQVVAYSSYPGPNTAFNFRFNFGLGFGGSPAPAAAVAAPVAPAAPAAAPAVPAAKVASKPACGTAGEPACAELTRFALQGVTFARNSDQLDATSLPILDGVATSLQAQPGVRLQLKGYTDSRGDAHKNVGLSQRRAEAVMRHLVSKGVAADRLSAKGYGQADPIDTNATAAGRANNRRVELHIQ